MANGSFGITTSNRLLFGKVYWDAWSNQQTNSSRINATVVFYKQGSTSPTYGTFGFVLYSSFGEQARNKQYFTFREGVDTQVITTSWDQPHNEDGSLTFRLSVGLYEGTLFSINNNGGDVVCDRIARQSTVSSTPQAYLGDDIWIDLNVSSSAYRHVVRLYAKKTDGTESLIAEQYNVETRAYFSFTTDANLRKAMATALERRSEVPIFARCETYNGGQKVGNTTAGGIGRCIRHNIAYVAVSTNVISKSTEATLVNYNSRYSSEVYCVDHGLYTGAGAPPNLGDGNIRFKKRIDVASSKFNISFTPAEQTQLYNIIPTTDRRMMTYQVIMRMDGVQVNNDSDMWSNGSYSIDMAIASPTFTGSFPLVDTNSVSKNITGNDKTMIQSVSTGAVTIPLANRARPFQGASIVRYEVVVNGVTVTQNYSATAAVTLNVGKINTADSTTCSVNAVDSRGLKTTLSSSVPVIPYSPPTLQTIASRRNNFEKETTLTATGVYSPLKVGSVNKNTITVKRYQSKVLGAASWGAFANLATLNAGASTYQAFSNNIIFDVDKTYEIAFEIGDSITSATRVTIILSKGLPIAFMDAKTQSLGVNMVPVAGNGENKLQVTGAAYISDNVKTQVMLFPRTGAENNPSAANSQYSSLQLKDSNMMMNGKTILSQVGTFPDIRFGGKLYAYSPYGTFDDEFGNIKAQDGVRPENTWGVFQRTSTGHNAAILVSLLADSDPNVTVVTLGGVNYRMNRGASNLAPNGAMSFTNSGNGGRMTAYFENIFSNNAGANPSRPEYKEHLELLDINATDIINSNNVYAYDYKEEYRQPNHNKLKKDIGVLINESLSLMTNDDDTAIKDYAMSSLLWKGLQEANARLTKLEEEK